MDFKKAFAWADRASYIALIATIGITPIFSLPFLGVSSETSKGILLAAGIALSLLFWIIGRFVGGKISIPHSTVLLAGSILTLVMVLAAAFSGSMRASFWGAGFSIGTASMSVLLLVTLFLSSVLITDRKKITELVMTLFGAAAVALLFQLSHLFVAYMTVFHGFLSAPTANLVGKWNDLAIFLSFTALLSLAIVRFVPLAKRMKIALYALFGLSAFFMILINFLAAWLIFAIAALALFAYEWKLKTRAAERKSFPVLPLACALGAIIFVLANGFVGSFLPTKLHVLSLEVRPSFSTTATVAFHTITHHPLFGSGPDHFAEAWVKYRPTSVIASQFWNTDFDSGFGFVPSLFVTAGLLGGLATLLVIAALVYTAWKRVLTFKDDQRDIAVSAYILTLFLWIMTIIYVPNIALFALTFAMTGTCVALSAGKKASDSYTFSFAKDQKKKIVAASVSIALALAIICFGCVTAKRFIAEVYASKAAVSLQSGSIDDAGTAMSKALAFHASDRYYRAMADLYMSKAATLLSGSDTATDAVKTEAKSLLGSAYQSAFLASTYDGSNYLNWMELGRFYQTVAPLGLQDAYANAKTSYVKALALNPTNPSIYLSLANLDLSQKNVDMAKEDIAGALAIKPDYTDALFLLAKMAQDSGDTQEAIRQVQKAQAADPTSFAAAFDLGILEYAVKDYTHAATSLEQAVAIDQSNLDAHYFLGLTYDTLGRKDDAIAQFEFIAQAHPDNQQIKDILANLKAGRSAIEAAPKPTKK